MHHSCVALVLHITNTILFTIPKSIKVLTTSLFLNPNLFFSCLIFHSKDFANANAQKCGRKKRKDRWMSIANEISNLILQLQQQHLRERSLKLLSDFLLQVTISSSLPFILSVFFSGFFSFLLRKKRVNWDFYEVGLSQLWQNLKCQ